MFDESQHDHTHEDIKYYLDNIHNILIMYELWRVNPELYNIVLRLDYIDKCIDHEPINVCPECGESIITDEWGEEYCNHCGLVTRTHYSYVAGQLLNVPFGIKI